MENINRIYHRYESWECYKNGFFDTSNTNKPELIKSVVDLFSDADKTKEFMLRVVNDWPHSSEHNLTNASLNRIAWLGQSACCIYAKVPFKITMEAWGCVPVEHQNKADSIAEKIISDYVTSLIGKQTCLKFT